MKAILGVAIGALMLLTGACGGDDLADLVERTSDSARQTEQGASPTPPHTPTPTTAPPPQIEPTATSSTGEQSAPREETAAVELTTGEFLAFTLSTITGIEILEASIEEGGVSISYERANDATEADLLNQWMNMALVTMTFLDAPQTITIIPVNEGSQAARVVIPVGILGEVLNGERSMQQAVAAIEVRER